MPSKLLYEMSRGIEEQGQDAFAKFYMYAALLHMASVRDQNKEFDDIIPQISSSLPRKKLINTGPIPDEIPEQARRFQQGFEPAIQNKFHVAQKIVMTYFRKGQLADMAFIIDKMLMHLRDITQAPADSQNQTIYKKINFSKKQAALFNFVNTVADLSHKALKAIDKGIYATVSGGVALAGLVVVVASLFAMGSLIVGATLVAGGGCGAYIFTQQAKDLINELKQSRKIIKTAVKNMNETVGVLEFITTSRYENFIGKAVVKPAFFSAVTALEQLAFNDKSRDYAQEKRVAVTAKLQRHGV